MRTNKRIIAAMLIIATCIVSFPKQINADSSVRRTCTVVVNGGESVEIAALELNYDKNMYISLLGIAYCLRNTNKSIGVSVDNGEINIVTEGSFNEYPGLWTDDEIKSRPKWKLSRTPVYIDGQEKRYYSMVGSGYESNVLDAFFTPLRLAMALDINVEIVDGVININTDDHFNISAAQLENSGYLQGINSLIIGDGTTGDIYFSHDGDEAVPIASTTKLMTYFVLMDAVSNGDVTLDDVVNISDNVRSLSEGIDGLVSFEGKSQVPISELIYAMLIASSNECALAIAEHVAGSEEAFVDRMNEKSCELALEEAMFYNCNGLPVYDNQTLPAKMQNHMSAEDMFILASKLIEKYPQVLEITSTKKISLPTLSYEAKNTNALLYNMSDVKGLKTGTTNKSGACLVVAMPIEKEGIEHNLICVVFGAEGELDRVLVAEISARIAKTRLYGEEIKTEEKYEIALENPELDVQRMLTNLQ